MQPLRKTVMNSAKLLLVDDEEDFITALAERLRIRSYEARTVTSGEAALLEIGNERPDVVILDLKMPGMDGLEVLREIKTRDPSIYVIMVTGSVDEHVGEQAMEAGATNYLVKPLDIEDLVGMLEDIRDRGIPVNNP